MKKQILQSLVVLVALVLPAIAFAHAFPKNAQPQKNAVVKQAPTTVKIWFTEDLEPLFNKLVVKNADGKVVSDGKATVDSDNKALLEVDVKPLSAGQYHVYWRVTSKDGHRTKGDYTFTISGD